MSDTNTETKPGIHDEDWDFWDHAGALHCVGYNEAIDCDALGVLRGIAAGKFCDDIAAELSLPPQYVELLQSIFCSAGWADYGTSPRGCFVAPRHKADDLVSAYEAYIKRRWGDDE